MPRGIRDEDAAGTVRIEDVKCIGESDLAIKVLGAHDGDPHKPQWIPKSVVHDDSEVWKRGDDGALVVAAWFAQKEGLGPAE